MKKCVSSQIDKLATITMLYQCRLSSGAVALSRSNTFDKTDD